MICLQHVSYGYNDLKILKDGFLRPANKTKVSGLYGAEDKDGNQVFSKWIYTRINTDIDKRDSYASFYINSEVLLKTKFVLNVGWQTEDVLRKDDIRIIDGTLLTKKQLYELLINFKETCRLSFLNRKIISKSKKTKSIPLSSDESNEILIQDDIDLHKYLVMYKNKKDKEIDYILKKDYPNVKII